MPSPHSRLGYVPALDGVRALALVAVLAYSLGFSWAPGGFLGVEVAFVLSGWLICSRLLAEQRREGTIDVAAFWLRRARRLLPAATIVILTTLVVAALNNHYLLPAVRLDAATALGFVLNWRLAFGGGSFPAADPSPLQHLWALSLAEQFALALPLALGSGFYRRQRRAQRIGPLIVGAAAALTLWRFLLVLGDHAAHPYYGTDTRAVGFLAGVALALTWSPRRLRPDDAPPPAPALLAAGVAALGVLAWAVLALDAGPSAAGLPLTAVQLAAVVLVAVLVHPAGAALAAGLSVPPLRWLGARSYSFYLWHWPIVVVFADQPGRPGTSPVRVALMLGLILLAATASYRFVELPIRRRGLRGAIRRVRAHVVVNLAGRPLAAGTVTALAVVSLVGGMLLTFDAAFAPAHNSGDPGTLEQAEAPSRGMSPPTTSPREIAALSGNAAAASAAERQPSSALPTAGSAVPPTTRTGTGPAPSPASAQSPPPQTRTVTALGDSIMLGAAPSLSAAVPGIAVDGEISRQAADVANHARRLEEAGQLGDVVVVHLGANGPFPGSTLDELVDVVGQRRLVVVNTKAPRPWEAEVTTTLADAAARHRQIRLVDWHTVATTEADLLATDGYHLSPAGAQRYAGLLAAAIAAP